MRKTKDTLERELFNMRAAFVKYRNEFEFVSAYLKERGLTEDFEAFSAECRRKKLKEYYENIQVSVKDTPEYKEMLEKFGEDEVNNMFKDSFLKKGGAHNE